MCTENDELNGLDVDHEDRHQFDLSSSDSSDEEDELVGMLPKQPARPLTRKRARAHAHVLCAGMAPKQPALLIELFRQTECWLCPAGVVVDELEVFDKFAQVTVNTPGVCARACRARVRQRVSAERRRRPGRG